MREDGWMKLHNIKETPVWWHWGFTLGDKFSLELKSFRLEVKENRYTAVCQTV